MPRPARPSDAGLYHLTVRSTTPDPLFRDDFDRVGFVTQLAKTTAASPWACVTVCLMTTHYHLLVDAGQAALPGAMKQLNWRFARNFNQRHGRCGHWVGGKYKSIPIESDAHLLNAFRYVVLNPVEAGLCDHPLDWPWSSYATTVGKGTGFSFVEDEIILDLFAADRERAVEQLRGFVESPRD